MDGRTLPGKILQSAGGVGRNVADALGKITRSDPPLFISAVGNDQYGQFLLSSVKHLNVTGVAVKKDKRTACYSGLFDENGECKFGVGDMDIHSSITPNEVVKNSRAIESCKILVIDGNIPKESINKAIEICASKGIPVWFEPTDISKATKPFHTDLWKKISFISPNVKELKEIAKFLGITLNQDLKAEDLGTYLNQLVYLATPIVQHMTAIMITMGNLGLIMVSRLSTNDSVQTKPKGKVVHARYYPPCKVSGLVNVSGAGDCTAAGFIAGLLQGRSEPDCVKIGQNAAISSLLSTSAVPAQFLQTSKTIPNFVDLVKHS